MFQIKSKNYQDYFKFFLFLTSQVIQANHGKQDSSNQINIIAQLWLNK